MVRFDCSDFESVHRFVVRWLAAIFGNKQDPFSKLRRFHRAVSKVRKWNERPVGTETRRTPSGQTTVEIPAC
jgi:hypothetical protein